MKLNNAQDAIRFADPSVRGENLHQTQIDKAMLDPLFWQALGKARGWNTLEAPRFNGTPMMFKWDKTDDDAEYYTMPQWLAYSLAWFFDVRMSYNGDETKFWQSLP